MCVVISFYSQAAAHIENTNVIWHTVNYKNLAKEICRWAFTIMETLTNPFFCLTACDRLNKALDRNHNKGRRNNSSTMVSTTLLPYFF